ncbi:CLUMA_CG002293, isoform A [Clunio marinus]|uniref:CLUMA_CG002293, isoform A n=1 Tax=Clunio marinus TaxID=568069 RepID=A0A1J1HLP7_9DIPT|nr:CLUMA_CG002293, isoform A [Clunio marinus]
MKVQQYLYHETVYPHKKVFGTSLCNANKQGSRLEANNQPSSFRYNFYIERAEFTVGEYDGMEMRNAICPAFPFLHLPSLSVNFYDPDR